MPIIKVLIYAVHMPVATLAALPPELPPGDLFSSLYPIGLRTGPNALCLLSDLQAKLVPKRVKHVSSFYPMPNSSMFVLPTTRAPAFVNKSTTVAS